MVPGNLFACRLKKIYCHRPACAKPLRHRQVSQILHGMNSFAKAYLDRHSLCSPQIPDNPNAKAGIIVVIPCFNEPDLISSLESLWNCDKSDCFIEVIVVINASEDSDPEIISQNEKTFSDAKNWMEKNSHESLKFFLIKNYSLPKKHAGVGLARKIGMDEAVSRFAEIKNERGIIVCFDADSTCDKNYLVEIENHFKRNPDSPACSIYFEHPLEVKDIQDFENHEGLEKINEGIIQYELFLRYYRQGLKFSGHPFAFHTIGSSMAVRVDVYCKQGGMNRRKAGEDFYFLQKIIPLGGFSEINSTRVIPSPRPSLRVPFGTGRAISEFLKNSEKKIMAYHPQTFVDLKKFCEFIPDLYNTPDLLQALKVFPDSIIKFLEKQDFENNLSEIRNNSSSSEMFVKRFFRWFDGFAALKFAHFARDNFYGVIPVSDAAQSLLEMKNDLPPNNFFTPDELLDIYRKMDRNNFF